MTQITHKVHSQVIDLDLLLKMTEKHISDSRKLHSQITICIPNREISGTQHGGGWPGTGLSAACFVDYQR